MGSESDMAGQLHFDGLSCSGTHGIFLDQGSTLYISSTGRWFPNHWPPASPRKMAKKVKPESSHHKEKFFPILSLHFFM